MVDVMLMQALMKAVPIWLPLDRRRHRPACQLVRPKCGRRHLIWRSASRAPHEVFRQAAQSQIIVNAHRINQGVIPDLRRPEAESDFYFVEADDPETAVARIIELVETRIPRRFGLDPIRDVQVLCPMNRGGVGARSLNIELQAASNPAGERKVERFGWTFAPGDKVMQIENDYDKEVYNGDIGFVADVEPEEGELTASFDGRSVTYGFGELDTLVPAYAASIHKSQGSEYPAVVIPVMTQHYAMLQRNLLYTGVTRGKRLVVLVGQKKAVAIAVRNVSGRRRWSKLAEWLSADDSKRYVRHDVGPVPAIAVAVLFGEQESAEQVNCVVSSMLQACPLYPQLLTYRRGAANRRFGPISDSCTAAKCSRITFENRKVLGLDRTAKTPSKGAEVPFIDTSLH